MRAGFENLACKKIHLPQEKVSLGLQENLILVWLLLLFLSFSIFRHLISWERRKNLRPATFDSRKRFKLSPCISCRPRTSWIVNISFWSEENWMIRKKNHLVVIGFFFSALNHTFDHTSENKKGRYSCNPIPQDCLMHCNWFGWMYYS